MSDDASALSTAASTSPPADADYDAIQAALMETERGRRFLAEYGRRTRAADIATLIAASGRIEAAMRDERAAQSIGNIRLDLREMAEAIARTKAEIATIKPEREQHGKIGDATAELDSIVRSTEHATSDILAAAERVQKAAWTMREQGGDAALCDQLDDRATEIYLACEFQDLTGQRTQKVIQVLRFLEGRINAMIDIWGADPPAAVAAAPTVADTAAVSGQGDIDVMMQSSPQEAEGAPARLMRAPPMPSGQNADARVPPVSWFDGVPAQEAVAARGSEDTPSPTPAASPDEFADLLFEPGDPASRAPEAAGAQKPDMLWRPLDVVMPDWAEKNAPVGNGAGAPAKQHRSKPEARTSDPLASLRAMSDEEKIALFS